VIVPSRAKPQCLLVALACDSMFVPQNHLGTLLKGCFFKCGIPGKSGNYPSVFLKQCVRNQFRQNGQWLIAHAVCETGSHVEFATFLSTK